MARGHTLKQPTRYELATRLVHLERELRGERILRRGWENDARRLIEQNKQLRAELQAARSTSLPNSAGAPVRRSSTASFHASAVLSPSTRPAKIRGVEDRFKGERRAK